MKQIQTELDNQAKKFNALFGLDDFDIFSEREHINRISIHNILNIDFNKIETKSKSAPPDPTEGAQQTQAGAVARTETIKKIKYEFTINFGYCQLKCTADRFFYVPKLNETKYVEGRSNTTISFKNHLINKQIARELPSSKEITAYFSRFSEQNSRLCIIYLSGYIAKNDPLKLKVISTDCTIGEFTYKYHLLTHESIPLSNADAPKTDILKIDKDPKTTETSKTKSLKTIKDPKTKTSKAKSSLKTNKDHKADASKTESLKTVKDLKTTKTSKAKSSLKTDKDPKADAPKTDTPKTDFPFYMSSISWCNNNYSGKSGVLIFRTILSEDLRTKEDKRTMNILINYIKTDKKEPINNVLFSPVNYSLPENLDKKSKNFNKFESIDLKCFSKIVESLVDSLNARESYFSPDFVTQLTKWFSTSFKCCQELSQGNNVVIEDIDHIRVSILIGSLTKIMMDPEYCTFSGFIGLIQTDWINRGYFYNTDVSTFSQSNQLNMFYAWLVCVECLQCKYPEKFEFTFWMLQYIINNIWTDRFFPFSRNCETKDDIIAKLNNSTHFLKHFAYCKTSLSIYTSLINEINGPLPILSNLHLSSAEEIFSTALKIIKTNINVIEVSKLRSHNFDLQLGGYALKGMISDFIANTFFDPDADTIASSERLKGQGDGFDFLLNEQELKNAKEKAKRQNSNSSREGGSKQHGQ